MEANLWQFRRNREEGFTLLELVVVIAIISVLIVVALNRYIDLLVVVERTSMEHDLGVMRSAVSMQVADHFLNDNMSGLEALVGSNPMDLLAEKPNNYSGQVQSEQTGDFEKGNWYFDRNLQALTYLVRNSHAFKSGLSPARARFKIYPVYAEKKQRGNRTIYLSGLTLRPMEPYQWQQSSNRVKDILSIDN